MTRYLYRVVDRKGHDRECFGANDEGRAVYATRLFAMQAAHDAECDDEYLLPAERLGPYRILRVPVTAWEEVK